MDSAVENPSKPSYSRSEELAHTLTAGLGLVACAVAIPWLAWAAAGDALRLAGAMVFGTTALAMFGTELRVKAELRGGFYQGRGTAVAGSIADFIHHLNTLFLSGVTVEHFPGTAIRSAGALYIVDASFEHNGDGTFDGGAIHSEAPLTISSMLKFAALGTSATTP